jgi:hypothetical protein
MTTDVDAEDILHGMIALYASLTAYVDTGHVMTQLKGTGLMHRIPFSTLYQKPSLFRFTFFKPHAHPPLAHLVTQYVAGFDGMEGYILRKGPDDAQPDKSTKTLGLAVAGVTGISSGAAHTIGRLLLPQVTGLSIADLLNPRLNDEARIEDTVCYSISALLPKGGEREMWIEKDTLLLRRVISLRETARCEEMRENISVNDSSLLPDRFAATLPRTP